jgi:hypothetical protein
MPFKFNALTGKLDLVNPKVPGALIFKGSISVNTDFPLIADVENGWVYRVLADVTDDAGATYTNTGQSFETGDEIAWNGTNWTILGNENTFVRIDGTTPLTGDWDVGAFEITAQNVLVDDEAYSVAWNGVLEVPTKNAVYDEVELKLDITQAETVYERLDGSNQPATGDKNISKADPRFTLTDTGDDGFVKFTKSDSDSRFTIINQVTAGVDNDTDQIPTMTSNTTPSGVMSASTEYSADYAAWKTGDDTASPWSATTYSGWLKYEFSSAKTIGKYTVSNRGGSQTTWAPGTFTFEGSNNDSDWDVLDTQIGITWSASEKKEYVISNTNSYLYYRLNVTTNQLGAGLLSMVGWEMFNQTADFVNATIIDSTTSTVEGEDGIHTFGYDGGRTIIEAGTGIYLEDDSHRADGVSSYYGTGDDGSIKHSGSNFLFNNNVGDFVFTGGNIQSVTNTGTNYLRVNDTRSTTEDSAGIMFGTGVDSAYGKSLIAHQETGVSPFNGRGDLIFAVDSDNDASGVTLEDEKMRITNEGKVGINTPTPSADLHVLQDGTIKALDSNTVGGFQNSGLTTDIARLAVIGGNTGYSILDLGDTDSQYIAGIQYDHNTNKMNLRSAGGNRVTIGSNHMSMYSDNFKLYQGAGDDYSQYYDGTDQQFDLISGDFVFSGGNVGIGTTDPDYKLDVNGIIRAQSTGGAQIRTLSSTTGTAYLLFGDTADDDIGWINYNHITNTMGFRRGASDKLSIDAHIHIPNDNEKLYQGAGDDFSTWFDATLQRVESPNWNISSTGRWDIHATNNNLMIGEDAGNNTMTGDKNLLLGWHAGTSLTSGVENFAIGYNTGGQLTEGSYNSYLGVLSGVVNSEGDNNTGIGYGTIYSGTGDENVAIGANAGYGVGSGNANVFIGKDAGYGVGNPSGSVMIGKLSGYNTNANYNTYVGYYSGVRNTTGVENTFLGYRAGYGTSGGIGGYNTLLGSRAGYRLDDGTNNIWIGYYAGYNQLSNSNLLIIDNQQRANVAAEATNAIIYGVMAATPADQDLFLNADVYLQADNRKLYFGAGDDVYEQFTGTNFETVGTGDWDISGFDKLDIVPQVLLGNKLMFTQTDGNEYIDSLADGYLDIGATTGIRLNATTNTQAGRIKNTTRVTTTYTILTTDDRVFCDTDAGAFTVTLPVGVEGQEFRIINSGSNNLTIAPNGAELINGVNSNYTLLNGDVIILTYETTDGWW